MDGLTTTILAGVIVAQDGIAETILARVLISITATLALALLSLLFASVRTALFYKKVEYDFSYTKGMGRARWDIQWEGFRLSISVVDVSNDYLKEAEFRRNKRMPEKMEELGPSEKFTPLFDGAIQVKLNSIVRREVASGSEYKLRFVFRRRRFPFA
jgi:hypothetical protein